MNSYASDMFTWHAHTSPLFCWEQGKDQIRGWSSSSQQGPLRLPSEALTQQVLGTGHVERCRMWKIKQQYKPSSKLVKIVPCSALKHSVLCARDCSDIRAKPEADQSSEGLFSHTDLTSNREIREGEQVIKHTPNAKIHPPATAEPD